MLIEAQRPMRSPTGHRIAGRTLHASVAAAFTPQVSPVTAVSDVGS